jgi:zinc transport system substrate-binding protein
MNFPRALLIGVVLLVAACNGKDRQASSEGQSATESRNALVVTSNYPLYFFASKITEGVEAAPDIVFPDITGDPTFWIPSTEQIQLLQSADAVILNGAGAEPWLDLITIDQRHLVDTSVTITDRLIPLEDVVAHQHGPEGEHSHQGTAFTTWLDPQLAILQARSVTDSLSEIAPAGETGFRANMAKLEQELIQLDANLAKIFSQLDGQPVLFSHPVYQYLQHRYEINGQSVHWEPDEEPSTPAWIALQQMLATHAATIMIWEDEPLTPTIKRLSNAGITFITFQTLANRPDQGDYLSVMRSNEERLESILSLN